LREWLTCSAFYRYTRSYPFLGKVVLALRHQDRSYKLTRPKCVEPLHLYHKNKHFRI